MAIISIFAITTSAVEFTSTTTIPNFTTVSGLDTTSRVLMDDGITYPSAYIFTSINNIGFDALNTATGKNYTETSVVAIEYPEGCTYINRTFAGSTAIKQVYFSSTVTDFQWGTFLNSSNLEIIEFSKNCSISAINTDAFAGTAVKTLKLPNTVLTVRENFIRGCSKLETVYFGASFSQIFNYNAFFSGCNSLKTLYVPAGVFDENGDISLNPCFFGWNDRDHTGFAHSGVIYYTGTKEQAQKIINTERELYQNKYTSESDYNKAVWWVINLVSLEEYNALSTEQKTSGCYMVYDYNECEAFYYNEHNYEGTGNCLDGVECTQCHDEIDSFTEHNMIETLVYGSFMQAGVYNKYCSNASDCAVGKIANQEAPAIFVMNEFNGFSESGKDGIAFGGFQLNATALDEYNRVNSQATVKYGVLLINPDYLDGKDSFFKDGKVNSTVENKGFVQTDMSGARYANISISVTGFSGKAENLSLILAIYAYTDANDVEFIQSQTTQCGSAKVTIGAQSLYTVTYASVKAGNSTLANLGEYVMPSQKEQQA